MKAPSWECLHGGLAARLYASLGYALFKVRAPGRFVLGRGGCTFMLDADTVSKMNQAPPLRH